MSNFNRMSVTRMRSASVALIVCAGVLLALFASCETTPGGGPGPLVISTSPIGGAVFVAPGSSIVFRFNEAMDPATLIVANFQFAPALPAPGTFTITIAPANNEVTLSPNGGLAYTTVYNVTVLDAVTNAAGAALDGDSDGTAGGNYVLAFTTMADPAASIGSFSTKMWNTHTELSDPTRGHVNSAWGFLSSSADPHLEVISVQNPVGGTDPQFVRGTWDEVGGVITITAGSLLTPATADLIVDTDAASAPSGNAAVIIRVTEQVGPTYTLEAIRYTVGGGWSTPATITSGQPEASPGNPWDNYTVQMRGDTPVIVWIDRRFVGGTAGDIIASEYSGGWADTTIYNGTAVTPGIFVDGLFINSDVGAFGYSVVNGATADTYVQVFNNAFGGWQTASLVASSDAFASQPAFLADSSGNLALAYNLANSLSTVRCKRYRVTTNAWEPSNTIVTLGNPPASMAVGPYAGFPAVHSSIDNAWLIIQEATTTLPLIGLQYDDATNTFGNQRSFDPGVGGPVRSYQLFRELDNDTQLFVLQDDGTGTDAEFHRYYYTDSAGWGGTSDRLDDASPLTPIPALANAGEFSFDNLLGLGSGDGAVGIIELTLGLTEHAYGSSYSGSSGTFGAISSRGSFGAADEIAVAIQVDGATPAGNAVFMWSEDNGGGTQTIYSRSVVGGIFAGGSNLVRQVTAPSSLSWWGAMRDLHVDISAGTYSGTMSLVVIAMVTNGASDDHVFASSYHD